MLRQNKMTRNKILFFLFFFFFTSNSFAKESSQDNDDEDKVLVSSAENIFIKYSINARVSVTIKSRIYFLYDNGDKEFPFEENIKLFDKKHNLVMTLHSNEAYMDVQRNLWLLRGDVEVISYGKNKLRRVNTELLYWDQENETFYNNNFVRFEGEDFCATGYNFFAKQNFSYYKMEKMDCTSFLGQDFF